MNNRPFFRLVSDLDMKVLDFQDFGKEAIKGLKMSPDSFVQMAIQLSFHGLHQTPAATYESAATRIYKEGRTEVIRSCSAEAMSFVRSMLSPTDNLAAKQAALRKSIDAHNQYGRMAAKGFGVDRHLLGLKLAAIDLGMPIPPLYQDPGYVRSSKMRLSTSQVNKSYSFLPQVPYQ